MIAPLMLCAGLLNGPVIARLPLPDGRFDIRFIHSLSRTPVVMHFTMDADNLYIIGSDTLGDGADLPYPPNMKMQMAYVTHLVTQHDNIALHTSRGVVLKPAQSAVGAWRFAPCPKDASSK